MICYTLSNLFKQDKMLDMEISTIVGAKKPDEVSQQAIYESTLAAKQKMTIKDIASIDCIYYNDFVK